MKNLRDVYTSNGSIEPELLYINLYNNIPSKYSYSVDDDYEIDLPEAACVLIPLYMASQLYKDDDISQATAYRNEFEAGLVDLRNEIENQHEVEDVMGGY